MSLYTDLQDRLDDVHVYSDYFMALCPFHNDHTPSFMVHEDRYYCKTCRASGTLDYLDRRLGRRYDPTKPITVKQRTYNLLPQWRKWESQWDDVEGIARAGHEVLLTNSAFRAFFVQRGIVQYLKQGMFGWLDGWNLFPVINASGEVVDIVARGDGANRYVLIGRNEVPPLYSPDWMRVVEADTIYIPFGMVDSWALYDCGLASVTGVTGKALNADALYALNKKYIIVPDLKEEPEAWKLKIRLGSRAQVKELVYPFKCKDPDDVWRKEGKQTLLQLLGVNNVTE